MRAGRSGPVCRAPRREVAAAHHCRHQASSAPWVGGRASARTGSGSDRGIARQTGAAGSGANRDIAWEMYGIGRFAVVGDTAVGAAAAGIAAASNKTAVALAGVLDGLGPAQK